MRKLWTTSINIETFEIERSSTEVPDYYPVYKSATEAAADDHLFGGAGYADFNSYGDDCVYAESVKSQADADMLVLTHCAKMQDAFGKAFNKVFDLWRNEANTD